MAEILGPQSDFQEKYLNCNSDIIIAGGARGSAKSYIGLMRHLRWMDDPYYRGFCIRKNSTTLMKSGGLFEEALDMYRKVEPKVVPKLKDMKLIFPSGASVSFSHYETDKSSELYRGLQLSSAFYDEATDSEEKHIWFLTSCLRTKADMTPSIWLTCNPAPDGWLRKWVDWWLYPKGHPKFGLPNPERNGIQRWILRLGNTLHWADTREELIERYGKKELSYDDPKQVKPRSITVLLGTIYDNPALLESNPGYLAALEALPEVEKRKDLLGDWEARPKGSKLFERDWLEELQYPPAQEDIVNVIRTFDFAGTLKSDNSPSPDYSASLRMSKTRDNLYIIEDVSKCRILAGEWKKYVLDCAANDPVGTIYYLPVDPNPAAKRATELLARELSEAGLYVKTIRSQGRKIDRFRPFASLAQNGGVKIVEGCCNDLENKVFNDNSTYYTELEVFTGERKQGESGHDD